MIMRRVVRLAKMKFSVLNNRNVTYKLRNFYVTFCFFRNTSLQVGVLLRLVLGISQEPAIHLTQTLQSECV